MTRENGSVKCILVKKKKQSKNDIFVYNLLCWTNNNININNFTDWVLFNDVKGCNVNRLYVM